MMRRGLVVLLLFLALSLGAPAASVPADVRIGVFGLFHPAELVVSAAGGVVSLRTDRNGCVLRGGEEAHVTLEDGSVNVVCAGTVFSARAVHVTGATGRSADLELSVPGRITRRFHGRVDVTPAEHELALVVSMDLETAVASVVAAEQIRSVPPEALKAQAVAARSFFVAAGRHHRAFEFCDTTHCQFLREPPVADHPAARAARETAGLVLVFRGAPVPAFYSASCGGRTRTLADAGLQADGGYPYFSVECAHRAHRAAGSRNGHGIGLCQEGAARMAAEQGALFADILQHYYPGTTLETREPSGAIAIHTSDESPHVKARAAIACWVGSFATAIVSGLDRALGTAEPIT